MERIRDLLASVGTASERSDEELNDLEGQLIEEINRQADDGEATDESLELLTQAVEAVEAIRTERAGREEAQAERQSKQSELLARVKGETNPDDATDDGEEGDEGGDDEGAEPEAAEPESAEAPEPVPVEASTEPVEPEGDGGEPAPVEPAEVVEPAAPARQPIGAAMTAARPASHAPQPRPGQPAHNRILVAGDVPKRSAGSELSGMGELATAMADRHHGIRGVRSTGGPMFFPVASIEADYPDNRKLRATDSADATMARVEEVTGPEAITAAGGLCAPVTPYYGLPMISSDDRPFRSWLTPFQADRGGITFVRPAVLTDILVNEAGETTAGRAVTVHTEANDDSGLTKTVQTIACGDTVTVTIDAIVKRLKFGNFIARTNPERVQHYTELTMAQHARTAERRLMTRVGSLSTAVNAAQVLGASRDVLRAIAQAYQGYCNRHRMYDGTMLTASMPYWVVGLVQNDLANQMASYAESFEASAEWLVARARERGVALSFHYDGETGQVFGAQGIGGLLDFPNTMIWYLTHPGAFLFLDGGTLDLGVVRDSTLNAANDFETFAETFEAVAYVGVESLRITSNVCADGQSAATSSTDSVCTGASFGS